MKKASYEYDVENGCHMCKTATEDEVRVDALVNCPKCGKLNNDNWPLENEEGIRSGGCQDCWEIECDDKWWDQVRLLGVVCIEGS